MASTARFSENLLQKSPRLSIDSFLYDLYFVLVLNALSRSANAQLQLSPEQENFIGSSLNDEGAIRLIGSVGIYAVVFLLLFNLTFFLLFWKVAQRSLSFWRPFPSIDVSFVIASLSTWYCSFYSYTFIIRFTFYLFL